MILFLERRLTLNGRIKRWRIGDDSKNYGLDKKGKSGRYKYVQVPRDFPALQVCIPWKNFL